MMTKDDENRFNFLTAYEGLGPGGLTYEEKIELADLRIKKYQIHFDDIVCSDDDNDNIINSGAIYALSCDSPDLSYCINTINQACYYLTLTFSYRPDDNHD